MSMFTLHTSNADSSAKDIKISELKAKNLNGVQIFTELVKPTDTAGICILEYKNEYYLDVTVGFHLYGKDPNGFSILDRALLVNEFTESSQVEVTHLPPEQTIKFLNLPEDTPVAQKNGPSPVPPFNSSLVFLGPFSEDKAEELIKKIREVPYETLVENINNTMAIELDNAREEMNEGAPIKVPDISDW